MAARILRVAWRKASLWEASPVHNGSRLACVLTLLLSEEAPPNVSVAADELAVHVCWSWIQLA